MAYLRIDTVREPTGIFSGLQTPSAEDVYFSSEKQEPEQDWSPLYEALDQLSEEDRCIADAIMSGALNVGADGGGYESLAATLGWTRAKVYKRSRRVLVILKDLLGGTS